MAHHVFITHAVEDKKIAELVCENLERNGIKCWIAPRDVPYGMNFEEAIVDAISDSSLFILILSSYSNNSPHVKREIQNAFMGDAQTPILPFRVEDIKLNKALQYYLASTQWLDASTPPLESHLESLVMRVRAYLPKETDAEAAGTVEAEADRQRAETEALARQQAEAERLTRRNAEEAARKEAEAKAAREAEAKALAQQQAEARRLANEEAARKEAEAAAARKAEAEAARQRALPEQPDRRLWYIAGGGATLVLAAVIVAAVAYSSSPNSSSENVATTPTQANSPQLDQVSGGADDKNINAGVTSAPVNAEPNKRASPVPTPSTARPSPQQTATREEPKPTSTPTSTPTPTPTATPTPTPTATPPSHTNPGAVLNGKAISLPQPLYPPIARAAHASGTVVVQVVVDENGNVISAKAISGHPLLQAAAVEAAKQAKFSPTKLMGQPVKVSGVLQYRFAAPALP
jgi:TonB family protein